MLDYDLLLLSGAIPFEGFHLGREGSRQLVEGALDAVLLGEVLNVVQATREPHGGEMHRRILAPP